jgi:hypothetical protein
MKPITRTAGENRLHALAPEMLAAWSTTKKAVDHAAWLHAEEFAG